MAKTYDPECFKLALHFLEDWKPHPAPSLVDKLAFRLQDTVEDFFSELEDEQK
jgi:hypothetical protein